MRRHSVLSICLVFVALLALVALFWPQAGGTRVLAQAESLSVEPQGGGRFEQIPMDHISEQQRTDIQAKIHTNMLSLERKGLLPAARPDVVSLAWPLRKAAGVSDFNIEAISNYVDQNPAFPNQVLDWNCGNRTYDQSSGYNHAGIDMFTWPFSWKKMDFNEVEIIAAAPGTIVLKSDGNFDRNCAFNNSNWNAVYVRHADNSVAWYGHMKNGSLTTKAVGDTVVAGERLGVVGSSGNSTGPHLHFELYNAANQLQDPFQGTCNTLNNFSYWANQEPYRVSHVNKLLTQSGAPNFGTCPAQEITNEKNVFRAGDTIYTASYFRDQQLSQLTQYSLIRPDGSVQQAWTHNSPDTYAASYWYWTWVLPTNAPSGSWKFRAVYNSTTYDTSFLVGSNVPFDYDGDRKADLSVYRPSTGLWFLDRSTAGGFVLQLGNATDKIAPADYDGDGRTDLAVYRPSQGVWYQYNSATSTYTTTQFGIAEDLPVPVDYDGDGKADIAVYRPSVGTWYVQRSSGGTSITQFGASGDVPAPGDYDGDGKSDLVVYRPSNGVWFERRSTAGDFAIQFGNSTDKITPADYDGDGKTDVGIYRPSQGTWYSVNSSNGAYPVQVFGLASDIPVPGDYDGDGRADIGVFRPSDRTWYLNRTTAGLSITQFGVNGDKPTQNAFGN